MRLDRSLFQLLDSRASGEPVSGHAVPYGLEATSPQAAGPTPSQILGKLAGVGVALLLTALSLATLRRALHGVAWADVSAALAAVPVAHVLVSLVLTGLSYLALTGYDVLGLGYLGRRLPYAKVALGSFLSYAFANNLGFALLTGGSARYRIYASAGLRGADIALLTLICALTFALSGMLVAALCLILEPSALGRLIGLAPWLTLLAGLAVLGALGAYVGWVGSEPRSLRWGLYELPLPGARSTVAQLVVGLADMTFAAGALYLLLPASAGIGFLLFIGVFAVAMTLGLASHVPGGLGVFETVILIAVPGAPATELLASLLVFRCIYYLVPLAVAFGLLAWHEAARLPNLDRARAFAAHTSTMAFRTAGRIMEIAGQWAWALAGLIWRRFFAAAGRA